VLPATQHKWTHPALTTANQAGTQFTYPGGMEGWADLGSLIVARLGIKPMTAWSQVRHSNRYATKPSVLGNDDNDNKDDMVLNYTEDDPNHERHWHFHSEMVHYFRSKTNCGAVRMEGQWHDGTHFLHFFLIYITPTQLSFCKVRNNGNRRTDGVKHRTHMAEGQGGMCSHKGDSGHNPRKIMRIWNVAGCINSKCTAVCKSENLMC